MPTPSLSIIVVFHEMAREAPRTLHTLSSAYQRGVEPGDYQVIAVDNSTRQPLDRALVASFGPNFRLLSYRSSSRSPAAAINAAVGESEGGAVCVCIDGARMLSPGIVRLTLSALRAFADPVVATLSWHLGPKLQNESMLEGYDQTAEDRLLDTIDWRNNGYELFSVACFAGSCKLGWFLPIAESNCLALRREAFARLGGFDERFQSEGGGLVGLDFYRRACAAHELVLLLGEGTFHQFHGGVATNVPRAQHLWPRFHEEYERIRGSAYSPLTAPAHYLGTVPSQCLPFLAASVARAQEAGIAQPGA